MAATSTVRASQGSLRSMGEKFVSSVSVAPASEEESEVVAAVSPGEASSSAVPVSLCGEEGEEADRRFASSSPVQLL
jgi:hypothetical protein